MKTALCRSRRIAGPFLAMATVACSGPGASLSAQTEPQAAADAAATIRPEDFRLRIGIIADDSMRGRDTPSPELEEVARYVARQFKTFGLRPGDGDSFLQTYPLALTGPGDPSEQSFRIDGPGAGGGPLAPEAYIPVPGARRASAQAPIVVTDLSDSSALSGEVAAIRVTQAEMQSAFRAVRKVIDRGAGGLIFAVDGPDSYLQGLRRFFDRERLSVGVTDELLAPVVLVQLSALPGGLRDALSEGRGVAGYRAAISTTADIRESMAFNTIGVLRGSDPELRDEYVFFTAHMDHVGVGAPVNGDSIYNGADDDASGTSAILELAEGFASLPTAPRRSLVFMTVSGEEKGLLGSQWYVEHPLFPLAATVADLNIDMIGRNWEDTVVAIGRGESSLGPTLEEVVGDHPELGLTMIDDPWPDENFYFRSDHYNFARKGVPILFFFTGTHEDYHRPSDEADRILFDKTSRITRLIFHLGLTVADADDRPVWDPEAYRRVVEEGGG